MSVEPIALVDDVPRGELAIRTIAMPADTNANGDIFGGWLMSQMDSAGGMSAVQRCGGRVVTVAVNAMVFHRPVKVGDILCVYTEIVKVGRTSMHIRIEAWVRRFTRDIHERVTEGEFTYVAIDADGRPRPVDPPTAN